MFKKKVTVRLIITKWQSITIIIDVIYFNPMGIRSSMLSFDSSFFSISTRSLTPSTTNCSNFTSEKPRRSAFEISNTPPSDAVSTPPVIITTWCIKNRHQHWAYFKIRYLTKIISCPFQVLLFIIEAELILKCKSLRIQNGRHFCIYEFINPNNISRYISFTLVSPLTREGYWAVEGAALSKLWIHMKTVITLLE